MYKVVDNRRRETLLPIMRKYVVQGSIMHTDHFRPYWSIARWTPHQTVNHSQGFKDPETGTHTNYIEGSFGNLKLDLRRHKGIRREHMQSYLDEYVFRKCFGSDLPTITKAVGHFWRA